LNGLGKRGEGEEEWLIYELSWIMDGAVNDKTWML
jgi:hypothetical protein